MAQVKWESNQKIKHGENARKLETCTVGKNLFEETLWAITKRYGQSLNKVIYENLLTYPVSTQIKSSENCSQFWFSLQYIVFTLGLEKMS